MMTKPMKTLELHYPMIQFLITWNIPLVTELYFLSIHTRLNDGVCTEKIQVTGGISYDMQLRSVA